MALRDCEQIAGSLGIGWRSSTLSLFAASVFLASLAGGNCAFYTAAVSHRFVAFDFFLTRGVMLTAWGLARFPGVVVGIIAFASGSDCCRVAVEWHMVTMGMIIIVAILIVSGGLVEAPCTIRCRERTPRSREAAGDAEAEAPATPESEERWDASTTST